jgi:bifunctional non-homologous end joining protein LigD
MKVQYPDRVMYPVAHFTKGDAVAYYRRIAPVLLPHLRDRPVTLKRYPDHIYGEFFYEKDAPAFTPEWVKTFPVSRRGGGGRIQYIVINDVRTLEWIAAAGTLEIHPFLAHSRDFDSPTEVVFDLDPGEGADVLRCAEVAFQLRDLLAKLELQSFAKVSGSKGLQVYVPLNTPTSYAVTQPFARTVAEMLERERPREITAVMEKAQRRNKVFIDWSQNADYKTTVAVYSLRAKRNHPYVSAPVAWKELEDAVADRQPKSLDFLPDAVLERVRRLGDLFAEVAKLRQTLPDAFLRGLHAGLSKPDKKDAVALRSASRGRGRPRASEQGGRRTFSAVKTSVATKLLLQVHDDVLAFSLPRFPRRAGESQPAKLTSANRNAAPWDSGTVELIEGNAAKGYLDLFFDGARLKGEYVLLRDGEWQFIRPAANKDYAPRSFLEPERKKSAPVLPRAHEAREERTADSNENILSSLPSDTPREQPRFIVPMECKLVDSVPDKRGWLYELKLDGYRIVAVKHRSRVDIYSRRGTAFNDRFPQVAKALRTASLPDCVLDGEIVALDEQGRPSFQELQNSRSTRLPIIYYVFDIVNLGGHNLERLPLSERKRILGMIAGSFAEPIRLAAALETDAQALVAQVKRLGLEGVVAKRSDSHYESGKRSGAWVKYRLNEREEFIIGGYLPGRTRLDALLVGRERRGKLYFVKKVRNGFVPRTRQEILKALKPLKVAECPFDNLPEPSSRRGAVDEEEMKSCVWVRPERQAEIEFAEQTAGGRLRHAAFRRLIDDL